MKINIPRIPRYLAISTAISNSINSGQLLNGMVLTEEPLSKHFNTSRTTIRKALAELKMQKKITKFDGRGFLVGNNSTLLPNRINVENLLFDPMTSGTEYGSISTPDQITPLLREILAHALPFGPFRISEHLLAENYSVSRTVIRETLARLQSIGLVRKDERSHWMVGPLSSRDIQNYYEIRQLLEPCALKTSVLKIDRSIIVNAQNKLVVQKKQHTEPTSQELESLEFDLHEKLLAYSDNKRLLNMLRETTVVFAVNHMFREAIGNAPSSLNMRNEHLAVFDAILADDIETACQALQQHLKNACQRTIQRLKTLSVLTSPDMPEYLIPENLTVNRKMNF